MNYSVDIRRRNFIKTSLAIGGGLVLGFYVAPGAAEMSAVDNIPKNIEPNAWIRINNDDTVTVFVSKSEMGQGVYTSMPMLIAEELEIAWDKIRVEPAAAAPVYRHTQFGVQVTGGSSSVSSSWEQLRIVGATMREMLIHAAAKKWDISANDCRAEDGTIVQIKGKKKIHYAEVVKNLKEFPVPPKVPLKHPDDFTIIGKSMPRLDSLAKVDGTALYGIDMTVQDMLFAVVARPPVFGSTVKAIKDEQAKNIKGVKMVAEIPSGVAVIATSFWAAQRAREVLVVIWDYPKGAGITTEKMRDEYFDLADTPGAIATKSVNIESALTSSENSIEAVYEVPYLAHAPMEPLNCLVDLRNNSCEIWTGTQFQEGDKNTAAQITGLKPKQITIHTMLLGGGFGRRANPHSDFVAEAVHVAQIAKKPVKVMWTRTDDITGGYYRPFWISRLTAGLDAKGNPLAWRHRIVGQSIIAGTSFEQALVQHGIDSTSVEGAADIPYDIKTISVELHTTKNRIPVQWWRSVGHSHTAFAVESFIDELARYSDKDPYEFRDGLLIGHARSQQVLRLVAEKAEWKKARKKGLYKGIAVHASYGSYVAQVAEVSVSANGKLSVHRVVCAVDCGRVVNPDTVKAQMEGGIIFGLSAALYGEITLQDGVVEQQNFDNYRLVRMKDAPKIEVYIVPSSERPTGVGEPGVPPIAPAVANALFAATGVRIRRLPIKSQKISEKDTLQG